MTDSPLPFDVFYGFTYASSAIVSLGGLSRFVTHQFRYILELCIVVEVVLSERPAAVAELELLPDIPLDVGLELPDRVPGERSVLAVLAAEQCRYVAQRHSEILEEVLPRIQEVQHHGPDDLGDRYGTPCLRPFSRNISHEDAKKIDLMGNIPGSMVHNEDFR